MVESLGESLQRKKCLFILVTLLIIKLQGRIYIYIWAPNNSKHSPLSSLGWNDASEPCRLIKCLFWRIPSSPTSFPIWNSILTFVLNWEVVLFIGILQSDESLSQGRQSLFSVCITGTWICILELSSGDWPVTGNLCPFQNSWFPYILLWVHSFSN